MPLSEPGFIWLRGRTVSPSPSGKAGQGQGGKPDASHHEPPRARAEAWLDPRPAGSWLHHGFHRLGSESCWGRKRKKTKSMGTIETAGPVAFRLLSSPSSVDLLLPASLSPVAWSCAFWPGRASRWRLVGAAAA